MIKENLTKIREEINQAAKECSRKVDEIKLIAVSKTKPAELIIKAYDAGIRDFGENKVQEIVDKYDKLPSDIRWHLIGHLQTNKVKYIIDKVYMIHSVDSLKLACEISKHGVKCNIIMPILIEVNVSGEESKFGVRPEDCEEIIRQISLLPGIVIKGLMTVAPNNENPEENRTYFSQLKQLLVDINDKNIDNVNMDCLSMGMSGDYIAAIKEGATYVRVGTKIFGQRQYMI